MARRDRNEENVPDTLTAEPTEEAVTEPTATEPTPAPAAADASAPAKAALTDEEIAAAIQPFLAVVAEQVETRDGATGELADEAFTAVNAAYSALDGIKVKNAAKAELGDLMKNAMGVLNAQLARAYMDMSQNLTAAKAKSTGTKAPKEPANPTESFIERVAVLNLAVELVQGEAPEGIDADWEDKAEELTQKAQADAAAYKAWLLDESEDKGDGPEVSSVTAAAVKLSLGKSAKPGKAARAASAGSTYEGPRRDIAKHIGEAFATVDSGTFLTIAEIGRIKSDEYGDTRPSPGAISARLFPSSGKCTVEGVTPGTNAAGNKGATKN